MENKDPDFKPGNWHQMPNEIDDVLPYISGSALKLYIHLRRNVNRKRNKDNTVKRSYLELKKATGLSSNETVRKGLMELVERGMIGQIRYTMNDKNIYLVNTVFVPNENLIDEQHRRTENMKDAKRKNKSKDSDYREKQKTKGSSKIEL